MRILPAFFFLLGTVPSLAFAAESSADTVSARVDRRPGILEAPSDFPTGENWYLYTDLGPEAGLDSENAGVTR